jgi:hypothetical protein
MLNEEGIWLEFPFFLAGWISSSKDSSLYPCSKTCLLEQLSSVATLLTVTDFGTLVMFELWRRIRSSCSFTYLTVSFRMFAVSAHHCVMLALQASCNNPMSCLESMINFEYGQKTRK